MGWFDWPLWLRGALTGAILFLVLSMAIAASTAQSSCNSFPNPDYGIEIDGYKEGIPYKQYDCSFLEIMQTLSGRFLDILLYLKGLIFLVIILAGSVVRIVYDKYRQRNKIHQNQHIPSQHSHHTHHTQHHKSNHVEQHHHTHHAGHHISHHSKHQ